MGHSSPYPTVRQKMIEEEEEKTGHLTSTGIYYIPGTKLSTRRKTVS
jgi:hypothetical protein